MEQKQFICVNSAKEITDSYQNIWQNFGSSDNFECIKFRSHLIFPNFAKTNVHEIRFFFIYFLPYTVYLVGMILKECSILLQ